MTIIKIEPEWNNTHAALYDVDYVLPGWAELSGEFATIWAAHGPFVRVEVDEDGEIVDMVGVEEVAYLNPEAEPTAEEILDVLLGVTG